MLLYLFLFSLVLGAVLLGGTLLLGTTGRLRPTLAFLSFAAPGFGMAGTAAIALGMDGEAAVGGAACVATILGVMAALLSRSARQRAGHGRKR